MRKLVLHRSWQNRINWKHRLGFLLLLFFFLPSMVWVAGSLEGLEMHPQAWFPHKDNSFPRRLLPAAATWSTHMYHTDLSVSSGARKLLFQMLQYRKIASLHLLPKKWQLNLCHAEAALQSHSGWQLSTLHAHIFPLCKCTGEEYTGTVIGTIGCSVFHVSGTKYRWNGDQP